jgi:hypothetical protein
MNGLDIFRLFIYLFIGIWGYIYYTDGLTGDVMASGLIIIGIIFIYKFVNNVIRKGYYV